MIRASMRVPIGSYALPPPRVFAANSGDQRINASGFCEAFRMSVLVRIGAEIFEERLPPWLRASAVRYAWPGRIDL